MTNRFCPSLSCRLLAGWLLLAAITSSARAVENEESVATKQATYQILGLFCPERVEDLRATFAEMADIELVSIDYERAEASFAFDPAAAFPGVKPEQLLDKFDERLRHATRGTFCARPLSDFPREELKLVEIPIVGLDCLGCSYGAYLAVYEIEGVEQATASFRAGRVRAWIRPGVVDRETLEEALEKRGVKLAAEAEETAE